MKVKTTPCQHNDLFCRYPSSCVGLKFYHCENNHPILGLTSDTGYNPLLSTAYADLKNNIVILHIGGIKKEEIEFVPPPHIPIYKTHLGLRGVLNFIFDIKPKTVILSEFGEEFKEDRTRLTELIEQEFATETKVIPSDVDLTVLFDEQGAHASIGCSKCGKQIPIDKINVKQERKGLSITYICSPCDTKGKETPVR